MKKKVKKLVQKHSCLEKIVAGQSVVFGSDIENAIRELNAKIETVIKFYGLPKN